MNICYVSKYANILKYGSNTRQFYFSKEFASLGHDVTLVMSNSNHLFAATMPAFESPYKIEIVDNVKVVIINLPKYNKATSVKRFWTWVLFEWKIIKYSKEFSNRKYDIVIGSSLSLLSVISGIVLKKKYNSKFVFEVRDIWPLTLMGLKKLSRFNPIVLFLQFIEAFGYKNADAIVGTMPGIEEHVNQTIKNPPPCYCVPQGVDLTFYENQQELVSEDYINKHIPKNKFLVIYAGTLGVSYALDKVLMSAKQLINIDRSIHFLFIGDGIVKKDLLELKTKYNLENVSFLPRVKKTEVLDLLSRASVLLHSFKMEEVFRFGISPNKLIDYMYSERPIILMYSGSKSMISDANCGTVIPSEDSDKLVDTIMTYSRMPIEKLDELGSNGKDYLTKHLPYPILARKYIEIFKNL